MNRLAAGLLSILASFGGGVASAASAAPDAILYKDPECICCSRYAAHLETAGLGVVVRDTGDILAIKEAHGVPEDMWSCHTMVLGEYVVEGHVPVAAIERLLSSAPDIAGIALPGMPSGSPGMPGPKTGRFVITVISDAVPPAVFMVL